MDYLYFHDVSINKESMPSDEGLYNEDCPVDVRENGFLDVYGNDYIFGDDNIQKQDIPYKARSNFDENYLQNYPNEYSLNDQLSANPEFEFSFHDSDREGAQSIPDSNNLIDKEDDCPCHLQDKPPKRGQSIYDFNVQSDEGKNKDIIGSFPLNDMEYYDENYGYEVPLIEFPEFDGTPKKIKNIPEPKSVNYVSPVAGWKRVFQKYSPSTETLHSPVKHLEANLLPNITTDDQLYGQIWILSMSEQFYYDNSIILLQRYSGNSKFLNEVLKFNFYAVDSDSVALSMVDVNILGSGTFGDVYRVRKAFTDDYFAIKFLKNTPKDDFYEHTYSILEYLKEKNNLIKARMSPFVVQFLYSVKFSNVNGLFLFFEWCLCDLRKYVNLVSLDDSFYRITTNLWDNIDEGIDEVLISVYGMMEDDLYKVTLIYIFEVFCALSFLAKCNIVHQDLKPENIMIATNLHLKIGDFGLAYNTKFITRPSQIHLVESKAIHGAESSNYKPVWGGTGTYEDMELCYRYLLRRSVLGASRIMESSDRLDYPLSSNLKDADPEFLSDLWSCGIIATELILGGIHFLNPENICSQVKAEMGVGYDFRQAVLEITYMKKNYQRYVANGLVAYGGESNIELMEFLASIFKPRGSRAGRYVNVKEIYRYKQKVKLKHIDIQKIENISIFKKIGLTDNNAFLYSLPPNLIKILSKKFKPEYETLWHLLTDKIKRDDENFFNLEPGIKSCYL